MILIILSNCSRNQAYYLLLTTIKLFTYVGTTFLVKTKNNSIVLSQNLVFYLVVPFISQGKFLMNILIHQKGYSFWWIKNMVDFGDILDLILAKPLHNAP